MVKRSVHISGKVDNLCIHIKVYIKCMYACINICSCVNVCIYKYVAWPLQTKIPDSIPEHSQDTATHR